MSRRVAVVTPWHGDTAHLLEGYRRAWQRAIIISVDNATPYATRMQLVAQHAAGDGVYLRNPTNVGFAAANNQGCAAALAQEPDVIVFANSDTAGEPWLVDLIAGDVIRDDALYGPALGAQLVAGRWLPYLEGWCIAGTPAAWRKLTLPLRGHDGPWDADAYPGPYWEDNDLCWRALQAGISLVQTNWPIQHLGGRSAGPLVQHGASFEQNRATFAARVLAWADRQPPPLRDHPYWHWLSQPSDMRHHLPWLAASAEGVCVELGCDRGVSAAALLWGVERRGGTVISVSTDDVARLYADRPAWRFLRGDSTDERTLAAFREQIREPISLLLLDSRHTYAHVGRELALWSPLVRRGGLIAVHDTEYAPGARRAVAEFAERRAWPLTFVLPDFGLGILEVA